ncbi:MAG: hypothetical protein A3B68_04770 [Candidatus Melainabacteria bacterium RIFCSPHIGHO2_02_FULL_34_12]|nr:MAG: hypothetical protein A3B68_04770 [Candidatus Melainabacteria bacterium RIFCSPHIGHO2_02_FULL_34_12]
MINLERVTSALSINSKKALIIANRLSRGSDDFIGPQNLADAARMVDEGFDKVFKPHNLRTHRYSSSTYEDVYELGGVSGEYRSAMYSLTDSAKATLELAESYSLLNADGIEPMHILLAAIDWDGSNGSYIFSSNPPNPRLHFELKMALLSGVQNTLNAAV